MSTQSIDIIEQSQDSPKHHSFSVTCLLLGGFGAFLAVISNMAMKNETSTIIAVHEALKHLFGTSVELIVVVLLFVVIGAVLVLISNITDRKKAFNTGLGAIAIFITAMPQSAPPAIQNTAANVAPDVPALRSGSVLDLFITPVYAAGEPQSLGRVQLKIATHSGEPVPSVVVTVRDNSTHALLAQSRLATDSIVFTQPAGQYLLVVDGADGYRPFTTQVTIGAAQTTQVTAQLQPSSVPRVVQKLLRRY